ncbi:Gfo/Idh/MocA family protein [Nakamurella flava]|uniref:Gfo/Idh/MocA family protein n=1 Tax=Nakamurella flava TaxID=2576308 RepID=UPI00197B1966|nr:Gfo/Idh/MocA family oxidoreductase [Nakamurella flava]
MRTAVVGAGAVSEQYVATLAGRPQVRFVAVVDRRADRAAALADRLPGARVATLSAVLAAADVDLLLNLTVPSEHAAITRAGLRAGRHVFSEKPLGISAADAVDLPALAGPGHRLACAPDTVLGTGLQTARAAVADGLIGTPVSAHAVMVTPGHERWHHHPEFFYRAGGGPLLDMGPYYLTALVHLLGPVATVNGIGTRPRPVRRIGRGPRAGDEFGVEVDTHETALLRHAGGAVSTVTISFDGVGTLAPPIEIHGTRGSIAVPDPNHFAGTVRLRRLGERQWTDLPDRAGAVDAARGSGVLDLADAIATGRPAQADPGIAAHVLETVLAVRRSARRDGTAIAVRSRPTVPPRVPLTAC